MVSPCRLLLGSCFLLSKSTSYSSSLLLIDTLYLGGCFSSMPRFRVSSNATLAPTHRSIDSFMLIIRFFNWYLLYQTQKFWRICL